MGLLSRNKRYDRTRILSEAVRAQRKRRPAKAIALYRQILEVEPENAEMHRKVAPLLAQTKQRADAMASYRRAATGLSRLGFAEKAIGVYREATHYLPDEMELWGALADMQLRCRRQADAVKTLLEGRGHFRSKRSRPQAISLLLRARKLDPSHFEATLDLAHLYAKSGSRGRALALLEELAARSHRQMLRRVRARQFRIAPGFGSGWRWIRACAGGR